MSVSPRPWRFVKGYPKYDKCVDGKYPYTEHMGKIVDANGEEVMDFGNCTDYYPTEGDPPSDEDLEYLLAMVNRA